MSAPSAILRRALPLYSLRPLAPGTSPYLRSRRISSKPLPYHPRARIDRSTPGQRKSNDEQTATRKTPLLHRLLVGAPEWNGATLLAVLGWSIVVFFAGHFIMDHVVTVRFPYGPSMLPTLRVRGDIVIVSYLHRRGRGVDVGDMISFRHPMHAYERAIKRVIGMPGDLVLRDTPGRGEGVMIRVPEGHCWVVGDNPEWSRDSRHFGPLPLALVRGKVVVLLRPWTWPRWFGSGLDEV